MIEGFFIRIYSLKTFGNFYFQNVQKFKQKYQNIFNDFKE